MPLTGLTAVQGPPSGGPFLWLRGWLVRYCCATLWVACALHAQAQTSAETPAQTPSQATAQSAAQSQRQPQPQPQLQLLSGPHRIVLHSADGQSLVVGQVSFTPVTAEGRQRFDLTMDYSRFTDYFLSMREMKCLPGGTEILCHIPYPHPQPGTISARDLGWLEHALMFMFKKPSEFGAKFYNGVYFQLRRTELGLEGKPQAVDLNLIAAPPARADVPPFRPALRDDMAAGSRWFWRLTIE